ncbi:copper transporter [Corynebacterium amycolatum]|uniref:copper transporter n=1 Tax=Corynebacterium TaxID=1716 RepID=UPI0008A36B03|nr:MULTISPECIES: copper transporter [Corynebacterium]MCG7245044.1 copper transporter [Corynebacterium sp. ACRPX]MCT1717594.1 copper transporter [Corynebacterium amycolatum]OFR92842.1 hypothetical protein HMPREF2860_01860 [Corynebacterium sp. HMSC064E10]
MGKKRRSGKFTAGVTGAALGVAAGAALGAYVLNPAGASIDFGTGAASERDAAVARADAQQARADEANRIIEPIVGEIVKDSLKDVPVLVIATPDATDEQLVGVSETLRAAGAPDAGVLKLTDKFLSSAGADELKDTVATSLPADVELDPERREPGRQAGQALAPVLELDKDGGERASATDRKLLLEALKGGGFVEYDEGTLRPAAGIVIVGIHGTVSRAAIDKGEDSEFGAGLVADLAVALAEGFGAGEDAAGHVVVGTDSFGREGVSALPDERWGADPAVKRVDAVSDAAGQVGVVGELKR